MSSNKKCNKKLFRADNKQNVIPLHSLEIHLIKQDQHKNHSNRNIRNQSNYYSDEGYTHCDDTLDISESSEWSLNDFDDNENQRNRNRIQSQNVGFLKKKKRLNKLNSNYNGHELNHSSQYDDCNDCIQAENVSKCNCLYEHNLRRNSSIDMKKKSLISRVILEHGENSEYLDNDCQCTLHHPNSESYFSNMGKCDSNAIYQRVMRKYNDSDDTNDHKFHGKHIHETCNCSHYNQSHDYQVDTCNCRPKPYEMSKDMTKENNHGDYNQYNGTFKIENDGMCQNLKFDNENNGYSNYKSHRYDKPYSPKINFSQSPLNFLGKNRSTYATSSDPHSNTKETLRQNDQSSRPFQNSLYSTRRPPCKNESEVDSMQRNLVTDQTKREWTNHRHKFDIDDKINSNYGCYKSPLPNGRNDRQGLESNNDDRPAIKRINSTLISEKRSLNSIPGEPSLKPSLKYKFDVPKGERNDNKIDFPVSENEIKLPIKFDYSVHSTFKNQCPISLNDNKSPKKDFLGGRAFINLKSKCSFNEESNYKCTCGQHECCDGEESKTGKEETKCISNFENKKNSPSFFDLSDYDPNKSIRKVDDIVPCLKKLRENINKIRNTKKESKKVNIDDGIKGLKSTRKSVMTSATEDDCKSCKDNFETARSIPKTGPNNRKEMCVGTSLSFAIPNRRQVDDNASGKIVKNKDDKEEDNARPKVSLSENGMLYCKNNGDDTDVKNNCKENAILDENQVSIRSNTGDMKKFLPDDGKSGAAVDFYVREGVDGHSPPIFAKQIECPQQFSLDIRVATDTKESVAATVERKKIEGTITDVFDNSSQHIPKTEKSERSPDGKLIKKHENKNDVPCDLDTDNRYLSTFNNGTVTEVKCKNQKEKNSNRLLQTNCNAKNSTQMSGRLLQLNKTAIEHLSFPIETEFEERIKGDDNPTESRRLVNICKHKKNKPRLNRERKIKFRLGNDSNTDTSDSKKNELESDHGQNTMNNMTKHKNSNDERGTSMGDDYKSNNSFFKCEECSKFIPNTLDKVCLRLPCNAKNPCGQVFHGTADLLMHLTVRHNAEVDKFVFCSNCNLVLPDYFFLDKGKSRLQICVACSKNESGDNETDNAQNYLLCETNTNANESIVQDTYSLSSNTSTETGMNYGFTNTHMNSIVNSEYCQEFYHDILDFTGKHFSNDNQTDQHHKRNYECKACLRKQIQRSKYKCLIGKYCCKGRDSLSRKDLGRRSVSQTRIEASDFSFDRVNQLITDLQTTGIAKMTKVPLKKQLQTGGDEYNGVNFVGNDTEIPYGKSMKENGKAENKGSLNKNKNDIWSTKKNPRNAVKYKSKKENNNKYSDSSIPFKNKGCLKKHEPVMFRASVIKGMMVFSQLPKSRETAHKNIYNEKYSTSADSHKSKSNKFKLPATNGQAKKKKRCNGKLKSAFLKLDDNFLINNTY